MDAKCNIVILGIAIVMMGTVVWQLPPQTPEDECRNAVSEKTCPSEIPLEQNEILYRKSIDRLPDEIILEIFKKIPLYYVVHVMTKMNKRMRDLAKDLYQIELKFSRNSETGDVNHIWVQNQGNAIGFPSFKIEIEGNVNDYTYLSNFATQKNIILFDKLQYLKIGMGWTKMPEDTFVIFKNLLQKTTKLKGFSLKLNDMKNKKEIWRDRRSEQACSEFMDALRKSKANDVEFKVAKFDDSLAVEKEIKKANVQFIYEMFSSRAGKYYDFLENLRRIKMTFPISYVTGPFLERSFRHSQGTLREVDLEFYYLIDDYGSDYGSLYGTNMLLDALSGCTFLEKLIINMAAINYEGRVSDAWVKIMDIVNTPGRDIFFGLKTYARYLQTDKFLDVSKNQGHPLNYLKLYVNRDEREMELNNFPNLEILKIVYDFEADTDRLEIFFQRAKKLKKLKEFSISYRQPEASRTNIHRELLNLVELSSSITKITVQVTSREYQRRVHDIKEDASKTENEKQYEIEKLLRSYVRANILKVSATKKLEENSFKVDSKLVTKGPKNDLHIALILEKKKL